MKSNTTIEGYKNYYASLGFQRDLMSWFKIVKSSTRPRFPLILSATRHGNPDRVFGMPSQTRENSFYFSFCVFLHALQAQTICKLSGKDMMIFILLSKKKYKNSESVLQMERNTL